jgi:hypothetical protein
LPDWRRSSLNWRSWSSQLVIEGPPNWRSWSSKDTRTIVQTTEPRSPRLARPPSQSTEPSAGAGRSGCWSWTVRLICRELHSCCYIFCLYGHLSCYDIFSPPPLLWWWVLWMCIIQHFLYLFFSSLLCS